METSTGLSFTLQKILLACGILAPLLYIGTDRLAGGLLKGYNFTAQSMSELSASGSPVRSLVVALNIVAGLILIGFGVGVWRLAGQAFLPRLVSIFLIGNVASTLFATVFFPTQYGVRPVFGSTGVLIMFFSVLCSILAIIAGAVAFSGWMRVLSIVIPVAFVLLTVLRIATAGPAAQSAPLIGSQERTMAYSFFLWLAALAIYLLLADKATEAIKSGVV